MNRTYKTIWNEQTGTYVAVAENTKGRGKRSNVTETAVLGLVLAVMGGWSTPVSADYAVGGFVSNVTGTTSGISCARPGGSEKWTCQIPTDNGGIATVSGITGANASGAVAAAELWKTQNLGSESIVSGNYATAKGNEAVAIGASAQADGNGSVSVGGYAGAASANSTVSHNTSIGYRAGYNLGGERNTSIGYLAGSGSRGNDNFFAGREAGFSTRGNENIAIGVSAGGFIAADGAISIGAYSKAEADASVALGMAAQAISAGAVAIGDRAGMLATGEYGVSMGSFAGQSSQGAANVGIGAYAGNRANGNHNTAVGLQAGMEVVGDHNTAIGVMAGQSVSGHWNMSSGWGAGLSTQGNANTAIGVAAGAFTEGNNNINVGTSTSGSLAAVLDGKDSSIASLEFLKMIGLDPADPASLDPVHVALISQLKGDRNVAVGHAAGGGTAGDDNFSAGSWAGFGTTGNENIAIGASAGQFVTADRTVSIGADAKVGAEGGVALGSGSVANTSAGITGFIPAGTSAAQKIAIEATAGTAGAVSVGNVDDGIYRQLTGVAAGTAATDAVNVAQLKAVSEASSVHYYSVNDNGVQGGNYNNDGATGINSLAAGVGAKATAENAIAIGHNAQVNGPSDVAIGVNTGKGASSGGRNVFIGDDAGMESLGGYNVSLGREAGKKASGSGNVFLGLRAGFEADSSSFNTVMGYYAATGMKGENNVITGREAGRLLQGNNNILTGWDAGRALVGNQNIALGPESGYQAIGNNNTLFGLQSGKELQGSSNVIMGPQAGQKVDGSYNVLSGMRAGSNLEGHYNIASGYSAGAGASGWNNVLLGFEAGKNQQGSSNIAIGREAGVGVTANGTVSIGDSALVMADVAVAIGADAKANNENDVALGAGSVTEKAVATESIDIDGKTYNFAGIAPLSTVSVGSAGNERTLTHVAAGRISDSSTDAINGSQLHATIEAIDSLTDTAITFSGDTGSTDRKLGEELKIVGDTNIATTASSGGLQLALSDDLTVENITINQGLTVLGDTTLTNLTATGVTQLGNSFTVTAGGDVTYSGPITQDTHIVNKAYVDRNAQGVIDNNPLTFSGTAGSTDRKLGETLEVLGSNSNITTEAEDGTLTIALANDLDLGSSGSLKVGETIVDDTGLVVGGNVRLNNTGLIIVGGPSVTVSGINMNGTQIVGLADGTADDHAVNLGQLNDAIKDLGGGQQNDRAVKYDGNVNDPKDTITLEGGNGTTITNLADGRIEAGSTDAVNGGQIHDMGESIADGMGGGSRFEDGKLITELNVGGNSYDNVNDALVGVHGDLSEQITNVEEIANAGWNVTDADGNTSNIGPNGQVAFVGDNNISVQQSGSDNKGKIEIALNNDITVNSITAVNVDAQKVTTNEIVINNGGPIINENGIDMSDNRITNVAPGIDGTDAVNVNQLGQATGGLQNQINDLRRQDKRLGAGIAAAMATASLPQAYLPGKTMMSMAAGTWDSESGMAIGFSGISDNGHWVYKLSGNATSRGDYGAAVGIGYQW